MSRRRTRAGAEATYIVARNRRGLCQRDGRARIPCVPGPSPRPSADGLAGRRDAGEIPPCRAGGRAICAICGPLRQIPFLPNGGITLDHAALHPRGAWGLGIGSALAMADVPRGVRELTRRAAGSSRAAPPGQSHEHAARTSSPRRDDDPFPGRDDRAAARGEHLRRTSPGPNERGDCLCRSATLVAGSAGSAMTTRAHGRLRLAARGSTISPRRSTGADRLMVRERRELGPIDVIYYRAPAASRLSPPISTPRTSAGGYLH